MEGRLEILGIQPGCHVDTKMGYGHDNTTFCPILVCPFIYANCVQVR